jgi:hypothetical protein
MIEYPYSMPIEKARDYFLNGSEVLEAFTAEAAIFLPRLPNRETRFCDADERTIYRAMVVEVFTGPKLNDFKQVIVTVCDRKGNIVYETDVQPYLLAGAKAYEECIKRRVPAHQDGGNGNA